MIAILNRGCTLKEKSDIVRRLESAGCRVTVGIDGDETTLGIIGAVPEGVQEELSKMPGVRDTRRDVPLYSLVSRAYPPETTTVRVAGVTVGGEEVVVIAGRCSVESDEHIRAVAGSVAASGARMLRGEAFKPRTSPDGFQGLGNEALRLLAAAVNRR